MTPRFRPALHALEAREVPALNLLYTGASLTLTGTPTAQVGELLFIQDVGGHNFQVSDGARNLGTYHVTRDITLRLTRFDTNVSLDLGGEALGGSALFDLGAGDSDPTTPAVVSLVNSTGAARVAGDVTFRNGSGRERFQVLTDETTIDIGGSVRAVGRPVATPIEDTFLLGDGVEVRGDVSTSRITYTAINGTVDGDVTATAADSPGGMGFSVRGTVHGNVTATGGATAPGYESYARVYGRVDGDVTFRTTSGLSHNSVDGTIGGDWTVRTSGGFSTITVGSDAVVGGDLTVVAHDDTAADLTFLEIDNLVRGDLRFTETGNAGHGAVGVYGFVAGDATIDLGGVNTRGSSAFLQGAIGGSATVTGRGQDVHVVVTGYSGYGEYYGAPGITTVTGDLTVKLGNGNNSFVVEQPDPAAPTIGGRLTYTGGTGADAVAIAGHFTFRAKIDTGRGDDTVAFAPDATLGSATIDFGTGHDTWTPPAVIGFPLKLKNLP